MQKKNIKKPEFYKITGLSNGFLDKSDSINSQNMAIIINTFEDLSAEWLLTGCGEMLKNSQNQQILENAVNNIPLIPFEAVAGLPDVDNIGIKFLDCAHYDIPDFSDKGVEFLIRVSGSSMYPKYSNGDVLACKRVMDMLFFQWGKIYVIDSSQGVLVKRVFEDKINPDNIILVSDNKDKYPPFSFPKCDIRSLSIVIGVVRLE